MTGKFRAGDSVLMDGEHFELAKPGTRAYLAECRSWGRWLAAGGVLGALVTGPGPFTILAVATAAGWMLATGLAEDRLRP